MSNIIHMNTEALRWVINHLRRILINMQRDVEGLYSIPSPYGWWEGGAFAQQFDGELNGERRRLQRLIEEGEHLLKLLEQELHEWEAMDAHFGKSFWDEVAGFFSDLGTSLVSGLVTTANTVFDRAISWISDPVDIREGYYVYEHDDLLLPPGEPFKLKRLYISRPGRMGWRFNLPFRLTFPEPDQALLHLSSHGDLALEFQRDNHGHWKSQRAGYVLETVSDGFRVRLPEGEELIFDQDGKILRWRDVTGQTVHFAHSEENLWQITSGESALWAEIYLDDRNHIVRVVDEAGHELHYDYDEGGRLIAFIDRNGHTTRYEYNKRGLLWRIISPQGRVVLENEYDDMGRVRVQRDAAGYETQFSYVADPKTGQMREVTVTYPNGANVRFFLDEGEVVRQQFGDRAITYRRDARGYVVEIEDPNGKVWQLDWDEAGRLIGLTNPVGYTYRVVYDERGAVLAFQDPEGARMDVQYDEEGRPVSMRLPDGAEVRFEYDDQGQMTAWIDPLGHRVNLTYDELGRITQIQLPDGGTYTYTYQDDQVIETDPLGLTTTYQFDGEERLTGVHRNGHGIEAEYTPEGLLTTLQDAQGRTLALEYDERGLPVTLRFPNGFELHQVYDALGHPVEVRDTNNQTVLKRVYDEQGRLTELIDAKGRAWHYVYDNVGNLITLTDRKGRSLHFEYDDAYRLIRIYDDKDRVHVQIEYNALGLPVRMIDAEGHTMAFTFDAMGRLIATAWDDLDAMAELDPSGQLVRLIDEQGRSRTYAYDARGNLVQETYPLGQTYKYDYDFANRLKAQTLPDETRIIFEYDQLDRLTAMAYRRDDQEAEVQYAYSADDREMVIQNTAGSVRYTLQEQGNVLEKQDVFGHIVRYEFTPQGRIRRLVYPDGKAVTYEYDANGNVVNIRDFAGHETRIDYDESDLPVRVEHPNGLTSLYIYDDMDRVVHIRHLDARGHVLVEQRIQRDATGRVIDTEVSGPAVEDLTSVPDARSQRTFTFNALDQIMETDEGPFRYDARGNLVAYVDDGQDVALHYDLQDRVTEAHIGDTHLHYAYDAEGNRVTVTRNGETRRYVLDTVLDLPRPLMEMDAEGSVLQYYVWGQGLQYALDAQGRPLVYLFNHRGDTLAVVDGDGHVKAAYTYAAYGQVIGSRSEEEVPFRFLGRWGVMTDHEGLVYIRARYYAPRLGFFTQPDRLHFRAPLPRFLNRYAYALDEPWDLVDVDGRLPHILIGAAIGGLIGGGAELAGQLMHNGWDLNAVDLGKVGISILNGVIGGAVVTSAPVTAIPGAISAGIALLSGDNPFFAFTGGVLGGATAYMGAESFGPFAGGFVAEFYSEIMGSWYAGDAINVQSVLLNSFLAGGLAHFGAHFGKKIGGIGEGLGEKYFKRFLFSPYQALKHSGSYSDAWKTVLSRFGRDFRRDGTTWLFSEILESLPEGVFALIKPGEKQ